jgi:hypothetical protein
MISNLVDGLDQEISHHLVVDIVVMMIMEDDTLDLEVPPLDFLDLPVGEHRNLPRLHWLSKMIRIGISFLGI